MSDQAPVGENTSLPPAGFRALPSLVRGISAALTPKLLDLAETKEGKVLLISLFAILLEISNPGLNIAGYVTVFLAVCVCTFASRYRARVLPLTVLILIAANPFPYWFKDNVLKLVAQRNNLTDQVNLASLRYATLGVFFVFYVAVLASAVRFKERWVFRRPVFSLLIFFFTLFFVAASNTLHGKTELYLWSFVDTFGTYVWFFAYALQDMQLRDHSPISVQFGLLHPFWGSSNVPHGKGATYLRKVEAKTPQELALCQLKGLKLLLICLAFRGIQRAFEFIIHGQLHVPIFDEALHKQIIGNPYPWYMCWASLVSAYFEWIFFISIIGNSIVGCARMAGFYLLRNTYKPIEAKTISEFFNRVYFYFKELLVDMFFYPTFVRYFRKQRHLRIAFATFMAAGVGNMLFHFIRDLDWVAGIGLKKAVIGYQTYFFYCVLLSAGIIISQLRPHKTSPQATWFHATFLPCFGVGAFYCFLRIFDDTSRESTLQQHFIFLFHLFGLA